MILYLTVNLAARVVELLGLQIGGPLIRVNLAIRRRFGIRLGIFNGRFGEKSLGKAVNEYLAYCHHESTVP
jgi:hypothetical protein